MATQTTIKVKSSLKQRADGGYPLALHERDARHPSGEVFIADSDVHEVAVTPAVKAKLADGTLIEVEAAPASKSK